ncbi:MAG: hypothetical protein ACJAZC_000437 [Cryomorphaceae bacterium]|jgi:hypothetical protein
MKHFIKHVALILCLLSLNQVSGQSTSGNNNPGFGNFLGYNGAQDLDFRTNNIDRMRLMETGNTTIDGYTVPAGGHLGLSLTPSFFGTTGTSRVPYSLLHLNGFQNNAGGPQAAGYRDWMRPGIVFTHNADLMYIGPKVGPGGQDITDAVISWSDNDQSGSVGPDVLRFLFTAPGGGTTSISSDPFSDQDYDGVEIARMTGDGSMGIGTRWTNTIRPKRTLDIVRRKNKIPQLRLTYQEAQNQNALIYSELQTSENGNLHIAAFNQGVNRTVSIGFLDEDLDDPFFQTTKLDVGGRVRVRDLPLGTPEALIIGFTISDINDPDEDQYLGRLDFPPVTEQDPCLVLSSTGQWENVCDLAADCRWVDANSVTVIDEVDITIGFPVGDNNCDRGKVGIGVDLVRRAKLEVENLITRDEINTAIYGGIDLEQQLIISPNFYYGVFGEASNAFLGSTGTTCGVKGFASDSRYHIGVFGESMVTTGSTNSMGVAGLSNDAAGNSIGVYGESAGWSGYFVGGTIQTGTSLIISDESVKTDLAEIENATDILSQLIPKSYTMVTPENRELYFDEGTRFGFIAQEMQEVLPQLVKQTTVPERIDSTGFVEGTSVDLLGI